MYLEGFGVALAAGHNSFSKFLSVPQQVSLTY